MSSDPFSWDNRLKFIVSHMYDPDNNGYIDLHDFECLALKYTLIEGRGIYNKDQFEKVKGVMTNLWLEMSSLADFNKDGQVTVDEFKKAVQNVCTGKSFDQFPQSLKYAITCKFASIDVNGDGLMSVEEYRLECVARGAFGDINEIDSCYEKLINDSDRKTGGINLARYQELYAAFISCPDSSNPAVHLFGPLPTM